MEGGWGKFRVREQGRPASSPAHSEQDRDRPALEKIKMATHISAGDTRAFYITNAVKSGGVNLTQVPELLVTERLLKALGAIAIYFRKDSLGRFDIAMLLGHDPFGEFSFSGFCGSDEVSVEHLAARRNCKHKNTRFMRSASL